MLKLKDFGHDCLDSKISIYVPTRSENSALEGSGRFRIALNQTVELFTDLFGGCTVVQAQGSWKDQKSGVVILETINIVSSNFKDDPETVNKVFEHGYKIKQGLRQEAITIELNHEMTFI